MTFACGVALHPLGVGFGERLCDAMRARRPFDRLGGHRPGRIRRLPEVVVLRMLRRSPRGNDTNAPLTFGVGYRQHSVTLRYADDNQTLLTMVSQVEALDGKRVFEHRLRQIEAHA